MKKSKVIMKRSELIEEDEFLRGFREHLESKRLRPRTVNTYTNILFDFKQIVDKPLDQIQVEDVDRWKKRKKRIRNRSMGRYYCALYLFFDWLPSDTIYSYLKKKGPGEQEETVSRDRWTREDLDKVRRTMDRALKKGFERKRLLRDRAVWEVLATSGIRLSELLALEQRDICPEKKQICVREGKGVGKGKPRWTGLTQSGFESLVELGMPAEGKIFKVHPNSIAQCVRFWAKKAKINKPISPHDLRHYFVTQCLREGMGIDRLKVYTGHKKISTLLDVYNHPSLDDVREDFAKVSL